MLTYNISCLHTSGPLQRPVLTNPNPLHITRVSFPPEMVSAAFMPGQSGRDLSLAPALKRRAGQESIAHAASGCTRLLRVQRSQ